MAAVVVETPKVPFGDGGLGTSRWTKSGKPKALSVDPDEEAFHRHIDAMREAIAATAITGLPRPPTARSRPGRD